MSIPLPKTKAAIAALDAFDLTFVDRLISTTAENEICAVLLERRQLLCDVWYAFFTETADRNAGKAAPYAPNGIARRDRHFSMMGVDFPRRMVTMWEFNVPGWIADVNTWAPDKLR